MNGELQIEAPIPNKGTHRSQRYIILAEVRLENHAIGVCSKTGTNTISRSKASRWDAFAYKLGDIRGNQTVSENAGPIMRSTLRPIGRLDQIGPSNPIYTNFLKQ
jgi:hypothetical protein